MVPNEKVEIFGDLIVFIAEPGYVLCQRCSIHNFNIPNLPQKHTRSPHSVLHFFFKKNVFFTFFPIKTNKPSFTLTFLRHPRNLYHIKTSATNQTLRRLSRNILSVFFFLENPILNKMSFGWNRKICIHFMTVVVSGGQPLSEKGRSLNWPPFPYVLLK